jgi:hypothetical protein
MIAPTVEETASPHATSAAATWREVAQALVRAVVVVVVYEVYAWARDRHGAATVGELEVAQRHARQVERLQDALHLLPERTLQAHVLHHEWVLRVLGGFYGTAHFAVTLGVLLLLMARWPRRLVREASVLMVSTFVAVGVFGLYAVAPPRLMPPGSATVDTLETIGGVWSYDHGVLEHISDPFAAMPSLHLAWATWVALMAWRLSGRSPRRRLWRVAGTVYPCVTLTAVLLTGTHWYLDAVAGTALVLAVAAAQVALERRLLIRSAARSSTAAA